MSLSNTEIAAAVAIVIYLVTVALVIRSARSARRRITDVEDLARQNEGQIDNLTNAWARSIAICESCGKLLFTTSKAKSIRRGQVTSFYCQDCKDE
jgi:RNase P subunit RPR2